MSMFNVNTVLQGRRNSHAPYQAAAPVAPVKNGGLPRSLKLAGKVAAFAGPKGKAFALGVEVVDAAMKGRKGASPVSVLRPGMGGF